MVAIAPIYNTFSHHGFENISVNGNFGAGFCGEHIAFVSLKNMAFSSTAYMASIPVEMSSSWWWTIERSTLLPTLSHFCGSTCGVTSYPYGLRLTGLGTSRNPSNDAAGGFSFIRDNS